MTNELMRLDASEFNVMQSMAKSMVDSGFFSDTKQVAQAMVKIQAGRELGLPPFASMSGIHIVQSKPVLGANLIATLVKNSGRYDYRIKTLDNNACILEWYENGKPVGEAGFTIAEANAAGLTNKPTWKAYASDMLFARAISRGARRFAPGIFGGAPVYTPDEMNVDTDEEGHIVAGEVVIVEQPQPKPPKAAPPPAPPKATNGTPPQANGHLLYGNGVVVRPEKVDDYKAYIEAHGGEVPQHPRHLDNWLATLTDDEPQPAPVAEAVEAPLFSLSEGAYEVR